MIYREVNYVVVDGVGGAGYVCSSDISISVVTMLLFSAVELEICIAGFDLSPGK